MNHHYRFAALGTQWSIETKAELSPALKNRISQRLESYDKTYSRFRDDSVVAAMRGGAGHYEFPDDFARLFELYQTLYRVSKGRVTPLIGSALEQAGYDRNYSFTVGEITQVPALDEVIDWNGDRVITTNQAVTFDVGAAGKGYAVDLIAELIESVGTRDYVIDASGDIRHRGERTEVIGLENPFDTNKVIGTIDLKNQSLCASSINRRVWRGLHHIFDPMSLAPVENVVSTWVIADSTLVADGLATALFFVDDPDKLQQSFDFSYVRLFADGSVDYTPGFEGELYI